MYETASLVDTIDIIHSNNTDQDTSPVRPTLHMTDWKSKEEKDIHLLPLIDKLRCSALTFIVKMILFADLQDSSRLYYISTNLIWTKIIYQPNQHIVIILFLIFRFPNYVDSTTNLLDKVVLTEVVMQPTENQGVWAYTNWYCRKMTNSGNHTKKTKNSGVCINQHMGQLRIAMSTILWNH